MRKMYGFVLGVMVLTALMLFGSKVSYAANVAVQDTDSSFVYYNGISSAADSTTADNSSAKMMNNSLNWNITYLKTDLSLLKPGISYDIYFKVKVKHAAASPTGAAFKLGVWDNTNLSYVLAEKVIPASNTQNMVWKEYRIGTFKPNSSVNQLVFYVAGANNMAQVSEIYVDSIIFKEHASYIIQNSSFDLYNDSIGATIADGLPSDNSAAVLNNGVIQEWNVQAPIDSAKIEAGVPYKIEMVVYPQYTNWDTSTGDVFGYLVYDNTAAAYAISPTVVKSTDWPVSLKFPTYFGVTTAAVTLDPTHTYHVAFFKVNNAAGFPAVRIDKVIIEKATIDDNPSQSISAYPYKISPSNQDGMNDSTQITYTLPSTQTIDLKIYNTADNSLIKTLTNGVSQSGTNTIIWDGKNTAGQIVPNGLYVAKVSNSTGTLFAKNIQVITGITLAVPPVNTSSNLFPRIVWFAGELVPYYSPAASTYMNSTFSDIKNMNANTVAMVNMSRKTPADYAMYLDTASTHGLKVIAMPDPESAYLNEALANDEAAMYSYLTDLIAPIRYKSALLNYYLRDEPTDDAKTVDNLKDMKRMLETIDPVHPVSLVFEDIKSVSSLYSQLTPFSLIEDVYPAKEGEPIGKFGAGVWDYTEQMDYFDLQIRKNISNPAPYWNVVQTFGGTGTSWRIPTAAELRAMTYLAIGHDAKGTGSFIYQSQQGWKGIVDNNYNHTAAYTAFQTLFAEISSMETTVKNMKVIGNAASTIGGGLVVSGVTINASADVTTHIDKVTGDKYLVVVNRDCTASQNVTITIDRAKLGMDISAITNVYDNSTISYTTNASNYQIINLNFAPGAGKLLKLVKSSAYYTGQDSSFSIWNGATINNADVSASDSKTAMKVVTATNGWDFQWFWDKSQLVPGVTYQIYAVVKIRYANDEITTNPYSSPPLTPTGNAIEAGVYDVTAGTQIGTPVAVSAANMKNMLWQTIKVGTFIPSQTNSQYVYISPANNMSNVNAVYVDKFYFIPA
ncbi:hypothetical protein Back11_10760 [Paenibacillus baekrokdamisoli]|uniref:Uncharacterized protein n=1 Tax=Paenibacillus baekrokdamisoli TaxID=1712516 RepID=A0A3G9J1L0_9BACL|nr:FlgD immunoglobulin-like domain containing protein [Paenibacillus baekrokdamisoli]MBB3067077.1 hypothetical protein [Paenibacillus baekrokdamisoli]BBH19731.1 hypothetical protein Back11_10760 [Paenibacillus baekrokdamisoli]